MEIHDNETLNDLMQEVLANNKALNTLENINIHKYYNCYCFVAKAFNWINSLEWLSCNTMQNFLLTKTELIDEPKIGDIMIWRTVYGDLLHTALIIKEDLTIIQKPGNTPLEYGKVGENIYSEYGNNITYRRVIA